MGKGGKQAVESDSDDIIHLDYRDFRCWGAEKFARYVNSLLLGRRNVDLHTFRLHWDPHIPLKCSNVRSWIRYAVKHKVKVLDMELRMYDKTDLPPGIFTCRSLQELNLQWGEAPYQDIEHKGLVPPDIIRLPSLKKLTLRDVEVSEFPLSSFIDRSPGLEELHLIDSATCLKRISSEVLKMLTLDGSMYGVENLVISAPHLISFKCTGCQLKDISWRKKPSLERAHIHTCGRTFGGESRFTEVLVHAKELALSGFDIKVMLEKELPTCSAFQNLTTLELGKWDLTKDLYAVLRFLQLSPKLEELTLMHRPPRVEAETDVVPTDGMTFQCPSLGSVTIQCPEGDDGADKLVQVLVAHGVSADKISVTSYEDIKNPEWSDDNPCMPTELTLFGEQTRILITLRSICYAHR